MEVDPVLKYGQIVNIRPRNPEKETTQYWSKKENLLDYWSVRESIGVDTVKESIESTSAYQVIGPL